MSAVKHSLVDSHCHPHFPQLADLRDSLAAQMAQNGVSGALAVATDLQQGTEVKQLAADYPGVFYAACGVHPLSDSTCEDSEESIVVWRCLRVLSAKYPFAQILSYSAKMKSWIPVFAGMMRE